MAHADLKQRHAWMAERQSPPEPATAEVDGVLARLTKCCALLAECRTAEDAKKVSALADAAQVYAQRVGASREVVNQAAEYKLRAERRLGEILAATEKAKAGRPKIGSDGEPISRSAPTLADAGISKKLGSRAQKLAAVPPEVFEAKIAEAKEAKKEPGFTTFADRAAREPVHAAKVLRPLPPGKYRVIYADPPWAYRDTGLDDYGHAERHYPAMTVEELCELPVAGLAADDSVLFLWVTAPMAEESFKVVRAWGFSYKAMFVWDKVKHNFGHYNSVRHELLLVYTRGQCVPDSRRLEDSVVSIERPAKHAEKPAKFAEIIDAMYPLGPRIELFARSRRPGWDAWGNEPEACGKQPVREAAGEARADAVSNGVQEEAVCAPTEG